MKRWQWVLLIFELALFALILILPQVDLPDFTFHGGSAPVAAKSRLSSSPMRAAIAIAVPIPPPSQIGEAPAETREIAAQHSADSRLSLYCTLIC